MTSPDQENLSSPPRATTPVLDDWLEIGKIVSTQGLQGEVRVYPISDFPERFVTPGTRWMLRPGASELQEIEVEAGRFLAGKGLFVVRFAGVNSLDQAEELRDVRLFVPASDRPVLEDNEFHVADLIGLSVYHQETDELMGTVTDVIPAGNDLLEVELAQAAETQRAKVLVPFVEAIVPVVNLPQKRIEVILPKGLLNL